MKMHKEEKRDKKKYIVIVLNPNVHFNLTLVVLNITFVDQKIEILIDYMKDYLVEKNHQIEKWKVQWNKQVYMMLIQDKSFSIQKQVEVL